MQKEYRREDVSDRPMLILDQALGEVRDNPDAEFLIELDDFIELVHKTYGLKISRRNLRLYHSPFLRVLPPPVHIGGHISYYLHPEHTTRLAVILHLNTRHFMPLKAIRAVLNRFPERHYSVILKDLLSPRELQQIVEHFGEGIEIRDYLFYKVSRIFGALGEHGEPYEVQDHAERHQVLTREIREFERWADSRNRRHAETLLDARGAE